jgi:phosphatidylinositol alpha 1,6-mannosyltransferase
VRVAIVTESFLPQVNGVTNSVLRVIEHLQAHGHEAMVVAPGPGPEHYLHAKVVRMPALDLPVVNSLPVGVPSRKVTQALAEFGPDVVHLASPTILGARGAYSARKLGLPMVAVYQTDVAGFASSYGLGMLEGAAWRWTRRVHAMAGRTLAPSTVAAKALREHGVPRIQLWARGVDTVAFDPSHRSAKLRAELAPDGELLVGYVGRLAPEKNVRRLAALADLPDVRVVVVGDGPDRAALAESLPDAAFLGQLTGDELSEVYASLDVFVHTGAHETFCQAVQEALASGVPVIAPNAGGPRDLVAEGGTGYLIEPHDDEEFGAQLIAAVRSLSDQRVRSDFAASARASVCKRTWNAVCEQLMDHYLAVIDASEEVAA